MTGTGRCHAAARQTADMSSMIRAPAGDT